MLHQYKAHLKNWLPPIAIDKAALILGTRSRWSGNFHDWASAAKASNGYDTDIIFNAVVKAAKDVRDGNACWERDSVCFNTEEYNWNLLACVAAAAAHLDNAVHVLDFGGALGSTYVQHRKILEPIKGLSWNIVEQSKLVEIGQREFATDTLNFYENIQDCFESKPINVVLFSSVLQYLENPYVLLEQVLSLKPYAVILDRTPISNGLDRIAVQYVPKSVNNSRYPCRFLSRAKLEALLGDTRVLTPWFESYCDPAYFEGIMAVLKR